QAAGIEAILNETTTPGHWRIWLPASQGYRGSTDERRALRARWVARANGALGGILAPESFVLSQAVYFGGIEGQPPIKVIVTEGARIDLRSDLDAGARYQNASPSQLHAASPSQLHAANTLRSLMTWRRTMTIRGSCVRACCARRTSIRQ